MLDSDDKWHPEYLASQLALLDADPTIDVVYPDALQFSSDHFATSKWSDLNSVGGEVSFLRVLVRECQIYGGVTARRETLLRVRLYDESLQSAEDFELWLRVLKAGGRIAYNNRVLAYNRLREGSHTSREIPLTRNVLTALEKVGREMDLTHEERAALDHEQARMRAKLSLSEGKDAFTRGDARTAIAKLGAAVAHSRSWKVQAAIVMLRIAPGILLWLYELRERWEKRPPYLKDASPPA